MNKEQTGILVSIVCITYNHENYIRKCLEGFIMQRTDFQFEILMHDDASTDSTPRIVREYEEHYSSLFRVIYQTENQYSQGVSPWIDILFPMARGKYIALCEGDDYWTDPYKLQKQVDFLEANPEYSMCFHNAAIKLENKTSVFEYIDVEEREYCVAELFQKWVVPTASIVVRTQVIPKYQDPRIINGDINLVLSAATNGRVQGMSQYMSVYRVQQQGLTIKRERENRTQLLEQYIHHYKCLYELYPQITKKNRNLKLCDIYVNLCVAICRKNPIRAVAYLVKAIMYSPYRVANRVRNLYYKVKK